MHLYIKMHVSNFVVVKSGEETRLNIKPVAANAVSVSNFVVVKSGEETRLNIKPVAANAVSRFLCFLSAGSHYPA